jgi:hypothetical protein
MHSTGGEHAMPTSTSARVAGHDGSFVVFVAHGAAPRIAHLPEEHVATSSHARSGFVPYSHARFSWVHGDPPAGSVAGHGDAAASAPPLELDDDEEEEEEEEEEDDDDESAPLVPPSPVPVPPPPFGIDVDAPPQATTIAVASAQPSVRFVMGGAGEQLRCRCFRLGFRALAPRDLCQRVQVSAACQRRTCRACSAGPDRVPTPASEERLLLRWVCGAPAGRRAIRPGN